MHGEGNSPEEVPGQPPSEPLYPGNPQNSTEEGKHNLERNEMISDCGSDIQLEEEKDPALVPAAGLEADREVGALAPEEVHRNAI